MKISAFVIILIACSAFFFGGPVISRVANLNDNEIQREEAPPGDFFVDESTYVVTHRLKETDEEVGDIVWMQKAAEIAIDKGLPYFNVLQFDMSVSTVEGKIQLTNDPMEADYDANEILSLNLTDETAD